VVSGAPQATLREDLSLAAMDERVSVNSVDGVSTQPGDVLRVRLPANLDDDQALDGLLFGGATLTNLVPNVGTLDAVTADNARVRSTPDTSSDANILDVLPAGTSVTAVGRDEAGDWLQVRYADGEVGWTADFLLRVNGDIMTLPIGQSEVPVFSPMQSFTVSAQETAACAETIPPGMLLYSATPNTRFTVNGANVTFDGVLFAMPTQQVGRPAVRIELLTGRAVVQTEQGVQFVVPGSATTVVVSTDLMTPLDAPLEVIPGTSGLAVLMTPFAAQLSNSTIQTLSEPAQGGQIEAQMLSLFAPDGLLPGQYRLTNLVVDAPTPLPAFDCALGMAAAGSGDWAEMVVPQIGSVATFSPDIGAALLESYQIDVLPGVQINGASLNDHNNPMYRTIPETDGEAAARTIVVNSLTSFTYIESWALRSGDIAAACYNQFTWEWTAP
jgi:SH3-like domain-containing protein